MSFEDIINNSFKIKYILEAIVVFILGSVFFSLISFMFLSLINKNETIIPFYIGIIICFFISKTIGKFLNFINNNEDYKNYYDGIANSPISNFSKGFKLFYKNFTSLLTVWSNTSSGKNTTKNKYTWIAPNVFCVILVFCYCYLLMCFSFSSNLNNSLKAPNILTFFAAMLFLYVLTFSILCLVELLNIYENEAILKPVMFDFILRTGIYNLLISFFVGLIISIVYFNIIKTFFKKKLFFQSRKICPSNKNKEFKNLCYYEPTNFFWEYNS